MKKESFSFEVKIRLKSFDFKKIGFLKDKVKLFASRNNLYYSSISLPIEKSRITVLKSPHVNKKAKDQFEIRVANSLITLRGFTLGPSLFLGLKEFESEDVVTKLVVTYLL